MKLLVLLLVILAAVWLWQRGRRVPPPGRRAERKALPMVRCHHCGVHLPHDEAVTGTRGQYCSTAHRNAAGDRNPD